MTFANESLTRQLDIVPMNILEEKITVIGAGAIGSWVVLSLAKMGFEDITVIDFDNVDHVNLNSQFYRVRDADTKTPKVVALHDMVAGFTGVRIKYDMHPYEKGIFPGIVISAVDNMETRELIWQNHAKRSPFTKAIIDPRMGAQDALLYSMNPMSEADCVSYAKTFYTDAQAVQERCTSKSTIWTANLLAGLVVKAVVDRLTRPDYLRTAQWNIRENDLVCSTHK